MNIYLMGFMGSGKTEAAKELGRISGLPVHDMDMLIEQRAGKTIPAIFADEGEAFFRSAERALLLELSETQNSIIATGGGTPCHFDNMGLINRTGISVYMKCTPEELFSRLKDHKAGRPLLCSKTDKELPAYIHSELRRREVFYSRAKLTAAAYSESAESLWQRISSFVNQQAT